MPLVYRLHILIGFTIFLISPFTRMIHIWSAAGALAYLIRPYQIVRSPHSPRVRKVSPLWHGCMSACRDDLTTEGAAHVSVAVPPGRRVSLTPTDEGGRLFARFSRRSPRSPSSTPILRTGNKGRPCAVR
ncbi:MAG TPA: respiratory nitrate reductase subunit gamma [Stellaceae bacterium]|nr:respiratory nitrate reductase subunit gamma [Stellaceae bacterium]